MIQAVLFDLDGLIIDTEPVHFLAFREFMRGYGVDLPESIMPRFIGYNEIDNIRTLKEEYRLAAPLEELVLKRRGIYAHLLATVDIPVLPGFWEVTGEARRLGLKQAVVSSSLRPQVEAPLRRLFAHHPEERDPLRYFDAIVSADDVAFTKPAPDLYLRARDLLDLPGDQCLALEDTPVGVKSAAMAGVIAYAVPNEYTRHLPFPEARGVLSSLREAVPLLNGA